MDRSQTEERNKKKKKKFGVYGQESDVISMREESNTRNNALENDESAVVQMHWGRKVKGRADNEDCYRIPYRTHIVHHQGVVAEM